MLEHSPTLGSTLLILCRGLVVLAVGLAIGCHSAVHVNHQDASDASATTYASYDVIRHPVGRLGDVDAIIEEAIHGGMLAKGYQPASSTGPDLLVSYKVLLGEDMQALDDSQGPPNDGLNGDVMDRGAQPVWDFVANDGLSGPQLGSGSVSWPAPGPAPVFDAIPTIDVSDLSKRSKSKTLVVMLQDPTSLRVVWLGWSTAEVSPRTLTATTQTAIGEIVERLPSARSALALN